MDTKIIKIDNENIDVTQLWYAAELLRHGKLVAFPTETVYGLGANAFDDRAVKSIYKAKGRPQDNPLIVHISNFNQLQEIVHINDYALILADNFWPGPLTMILPKKDVIATSVSAGLNTIAIRLPSNKIARQLIELCNLPIAAPSANTSGKPSPTLAKHVIEDLFGRVDAIIDGGDCTYGIESTVIDISGEIPIILRPGSITFEDIKNYIPNVEIDTNFKKNTPKSPGMKYKHYAPKAKINVYEGNVLDAHKQIIKDIEILREKDLKIGVFCKKNIYTNTNLTIEWQGDATQVAKLLFKSLREFDEQGIDIILCEPLEESPLGLSVRNRLYKAAGYNIIKVGENL